MKKTIGLAVAACAVLFAGQPARAGADAGSWYVAPQLEGVWLDKKWAADDSMGFGFAIGRALSEKWNVELGLLGSSHDGAAGSKLKLQGGSIAVQRLFYRDQRVNPFISVGIGQLESKVLGAKDSNFFVKYGVGLLADLAKNAEKGTDLQFRGEVFGRRSDSPGPGDLVDYVLGAGLQYSWGGTVVPKVIDSDGDGVPDNMDKCPNTPAGTPVNADGCELDSDGDGIVDSKDKCPNTPAGAKVNADGCELDSDGDGVLDSKDQCPDTPKGERVDSVGCPFKNEIKLPGVVFDNDKADIKPESFAVLDGAVETLKRYPELKIEVAGHTDNRASDGYNLQLSKRRAEAVMAYLQSKGVANALSAKGYGKRQPIASNATDEGRAQNRRVVLRVLN